MQTGPSTTTNNSNKPKDQALSELGLAVLNAAGIDTSNWGQGMARSVQDFCDELNKREISLQVVRTTPVVRIDVIYIKEDGKCLVLYESSQEFFVREMPPEERRQSNDWEIERSRSRDTKENKWAIWEKLIMLPEGRLETPEEAATRALCGEELPFTAPIADQLSAPIPFEELEPPMDYPGLSTLLTGTTYQIVLTPQQYELIKDGHTEVQDRKQTHFRWRAADFSKES